MTNSGSRRGRKLVVALSLAMLVSESGARPSAPTSETAQKVFKNVQVLKDISADDLVPSMEFIAGSLGVSCDFCHVKNAFDKDDKPPKKIARQMIQMVLTLNGETFQGRRAVTCYTCHRGGRAPVSIPAIGTKVSPDLEDAYIGEVIPEDLQPKPSGDLPPVGEILTKYVAAAGSQTAINKISSRMEKGSVSFDGGPPFPVEVLTKTPEKRILTIHLQSGDSVSAFDGSQGWTSSPGSPVRNMHRADLAGAKLDADLHFALNLRNMFSEFRAMQKTKIEGVDSILVFASNQNEPPLELYFDLDSGLLLRQVRFAMSPLGLIPTRIDYSDYQDSDGVKVPRHLIISAPNKRLDINFDVVQQNVPVPDTKFERP